MFFDQFLVRVSIFFDSNASVTSSFYTVFLHEIRAGTNEYIQWNETKKYRLNEVNN